MSDTQQQLVDTYFHDRSDYWKNLYHLDGVHPEIIRVRRDVVLAFVDKLGLSPQANVLEIGSGAGLTTVALAQRGYSMTAVDTVDAMVETTRQLATQEGVGQRVVAQQADTNSLPFPDETFELVLAIGVLPWVQAQADSLREMVRVLKSGGSLLVTAQNRSLTTRLAMRMAGSVLRRLHIMKPRSEPPLKYCSPREFDGLLSRVGLAKSASRTVGFPMVSYLPKGFQVPAHRHLQNLAGLGFPLIRSAGTNYVVLSRKH